MHSKIAVICTVISLAVLTGCKTVESTRVVYQDAPVSYQFVSDVIDEETIEHSVKFRNIGTEIISFDYTITDDPAVPHIDCLGPNSGLVENLYPGAEVMVKNTQRSSDVVGIVPSAVAARNTGIQVVLGRLTYGKRTSDELARSYKPETVKEESSGGLNLEAESLLGSNG